MNIVLLVRVLVSFFFPILPQPGGGKKKNAGFFRQFEILLDLKATGMSPPCQPGLLLQQINHHCHGEMMMAHSGEPRSGEPGVPYPMEVWLFPPA